MNKARNLRGILPMLLTLSCLGMLVANTGAQTRIPINRTPPKAAPPPSAKTSGAPGAPRTAPRPFVRSVGQPAAPLSGGSGTRIQNHPFRASLTRIPSSVTRRKLKQGALSRAPGDENVTRQTNLVSYQYLPPNTGVNQSSGILPLPNVPSAAQDLQPNWSADEKYIYFTSNRVSTANTAANTNTTPSGISVFNIYRMYPDGSGVVSVDLNFDEPAPNNTIPADQKLEPNIDVSGNRLAFVRGGTITVSPDQSISTVGFQLYYLNSTDTTQPKRKIVGLTQRNSQALNFTDVRHPSWSPGGNQIVFAGKLTGQTVYHIFTVNTDTTTITQLTTGSSNDTAPAWSPSITVGSATGSVIAFTSNASAFTAGVNGAAVTAAGIQPRTDIYSIYFNLFAPDVVKVTDSTIMLGGSAGIASNNRNPAWSTTRPDPLGNIPATTYLAFASDRIAPGGAGTAFTMQSTNGSTDIYYLTATITSDTPAAGQLAFKVSTPETAGNAAILLQTSTPGFANDMALTQTEFSSTFDPGHISAEDYPAWPQFIGSYRIAYQSNKGGELNIWASTIIDVNAPTLIKYDIPNNQIVGVFLDSAAQTPGTDTTAYRREFSAGDTVRFRVRLADYESSIASAFIQIKCPDSSPQSSDGIEHKIFFDGVTAAEDAFGLAFPPPPTVYGADGNNAAGDFTTGTGGAPIEYDCAAVDTRPGVAAADLFHPAGTFAPPMAFGASLGPASWNNYSPGTDDLFAFSGGAAPPDMFWLPLSDSGPNAAAPLVKEPANEVTGDGIWTAVWKTPADFPSDWYIDVIVYDNAINPFNPMQTTNWKIYDNIWGFTTRPFQYDPRAEILYVNEYDIGQKFFQTNFGTTTSQNGATVLYPGVPTESYMTEIDSTLYPTLWFDYKTKTAPPPNGVLLQVTNSFGPNSYGSPPPPLGAFPLLPDAQYPGDAQTDSDGSDTPPTQRYAQWRILARGPVPDSVLNAFGPRIDTQPADLLTPNATPKQVTVAERCVIWHSPYTGDLFVGPGTIIDSAVQNQIRAFVARGGRIFLSGQDVAWALSGAPNAALGNIPGNGNPTGIAFLNDVFHVAYASDNGGSGTLAMSAGNGTAPIATQTWYSGRNHRFTGPGGTFDPPSSGPITLFFRSRGTGGGTTQSWSCPNNDSLDIVTATTAAAQDVSGVDATNGGPAILWYSDPLVHSRTVFSPIPWESISPDWYVPPSPPNPMPPPLLMGLKNRRMELLHNVGDYLRTGRIVGTVRNINNAAQTIGGVFVRAVSIRATGAIPAAAATTYSQADGSFVLAGLPADGPYLIDVVGQGYLVSHIAADTFHGGYQARQDIYLTPAQPGSISGSVVVDATGAPVPGAVVLATDPNPNGRTFTATADVNGSFKILQVPVIFDPANPNNPNNGYIVTIQAASLTALGYGSSRPAQIIIAVGPTQDVTLPDAVTGSSGSFRLVQNPGTVIVKVLASGTNAPIAGASVTVGTVTGTAGADGMVTFSALPPGNYQTTVTAPGYTNPVGQTAAVTSGSSTTLTFTLSTAPPGSLSGTVTDGNTTAPAYIANAVVSLLDGAGNPLKDSNGVAITAISTGRQTNGTYVYNYVFNGTAPTGSVMVSVSKNGYTNVTNPPTMTVTIASGQETKNVNFVLQPKATFDAGLIMVSAPQEYSTPIILLLGIPLADQARTVLFAWDPTANSGSGAYVRSPQPPADSLHRGRGYFLSTPNGGQLTSDGTGSDTDTPSITLYPGWNMIGNPYSFPIDLTQLTIDGTATTVLQAQSASPAVLGGAVYTYFGGSYTLAYSLEAYRGYWVRAYRQVTLNFRPSAKITRAAPLRTPGSNGDGWTLNLMAQAGDKNSAPGYLGISRAAVDGFDRFKLEVPPTINQDGVSVVFEHNDWGDKSGRYMMDVRSPAQANQKWQFTVNSGVMNTPVVLHWPSVATIPGKQQMLLTDTDSNVTINLRNRNSYTIPASDKPIARHFTLALSRAGSQKLRLSDVVARRAGSGRAAGVVISYRLSSEADVQIKVMQGGRAIRVLEPSRHRAAGTVDTNWDLRDDQGVAVAGDTYTVEIRAADTDGNVVRQVTPLLITR